MTIGAAGIGGHNIVNADVDRGDRAVLVTIDSCRLADTRAGAQYVGPREEPLGATETHVFDARQSGVPCSGSIPSAATSLLVNVTALNATVESFLTFWPSGDRPKVASLNPAPGQPPTPNAVTIELSDGDTFNAYNNAGSVDVVIDVVGYYENHTHDDRYYARSVIDRFAESSATCTAAEFFPITSTAGYEGGVGVRATSGNEPLVCALDIPELAVIESFTSYIYDNSAASNGYCELGTHVLQTRETLPLTTGASTAGQSGLPQKVVTSGPGTFVNEGMQIYVMCTSPDALVAVSGVTVDFRLRG